MEPSGHTSPDQKPRQTLGSRFSSCLVIAVAFILIDLAILLYFLWPLTPQKDVEQVSPAPAGIENEVNNSASPAELQRKQ